MASDNNVSFFITIMFKKTYFEARLWSNFIKILLCYLQLSFLRWLDKVTCDNKCWVKLSPHWKTKVDRHTSSEEKSVNTYFVFHSNEKQETMSAGGM